MTQLLLGIDIGTGSTKAVLATPAGEIVRSASRSHQMSMPRPGWAEMDADAIWWTEVAELCRELLDGMSGRLAGVAVSGLGPCLLVTDEHDRPLRQAILYGIDMRAGQEIDELQRILGADQVLARCGSALSTQAVGPKMRWLQRHEPEVWDRARRWHNSSSYIVARLTGEYVLDHHTASQSVPLYDLGAQDWAEDWAGAVAQDLDLPRLAWPTDVVGQVTATAAARTGIPEGTPVTAGTIDAWAEAFSAGVRRPGDLMLMYGSTMFLVQVVPPESVTSKAPGRHMLWGTAGVEPGSRTLAAGMATSGSLTTWVQDLTGGVPFETLVEEAARTPPGADGLLLLPYFAGERTPIFDPNARGVIAGLTLRHSRGHLFRAAYEGIALGINQILDLFAATATPVERLIAVGGGTQGGLWTQIVSDVTGREQLLPAQTIGASYGDALLAGIGVGLLPPATDWASVAATVRPDPDNVAVYSELHEHYANLYGSTRDVVHYLAQRQG